MSTTNKGSNGKKLIYAGILAAGILAGCSAPQAAESTEPIVFHERSKKLVDGRTVVCLYTESRIGGYSNGTITNFDCDFPARTQK